MDLIISAVENIIVDTYDNGKYNTFTPENVKAEDILRLVSARCNGDFSKVEKIYINMGPGSFTGIRASMALVLGLVAGKNISIIPFTTFDAFEYDKLTARQILVVNGFSNFVYVKYKDKGRVKSDCVEIQKLLEYATLNKKEIVSYSKQIIDFFKNHNVKCNQVNFSPMFAVEKHKNGKLEKRLFEPVYLRLSQAELQRKENKK